MATWRELSPEQRDDLLRRKKNGENVEDLAQELGMYTITLARNLQKWQKERFGVGGNGSGPAEQVFEDDQDVNHKTVTYTGRIITVEQLLAVTAVDLNKWEVERSQVNKWEGYRKADKKSLRWEGGSIQDGFVDDDGSLVIEPLFQVKVWLVRKHPIPIKPVIKPVKLAVTPIKDYGGLDRDTRVALIVPDTHFGFKRNYHTGKLIPFHDRIALMAVLQIVSMLQFNEIIFVGDYLDMADWSDKFLRTPDFEQLTQPAVEEGAWWLGQFRTEAPTSDIYLIEGNHDKRLNDMIVRHLPQAYYLRAANARVDYSAWSIPNLLGLSDLGIHWVGDYPNGAVWLSDNLVVVHGDALSADKVVAQSEVNTVFGHIHRFDQASRTIYRRGEPEVITAMSPGFLGKLDGSVPGAKAKQNWSQGVVIAYYTDDGKYVTLVHVPIKQGAAVVEGTVVRGFDPVKQISRDTGNRWNF